MNNYYSDLSEKAEQLLQAGNYTEAVEVFTELITSYPEILENYWKLGISLLLSQQEEEAQLVWLSAIANLSDDESQAALQDLGEILIESAQYHEAQENYLNAWLLRQYVRQNHPDPSVIFINELHLVLDAIRAGLLARLESSQEKLESSFFPILRLLTSQKTPLCDVKFLFETFLEIKRFSLFASRTFLEACIKYYTYQLENHPNNAELWMYLGNAYSSFQVYQDNCSDLARFAYEKAISLSPNYAEAYYYYSDFLLAHYNLGYFHLSKNDLFIDIVKYAQKAVALSTEFSEAFYRLGSLLEAQGKTKEAIDLFGQALTVNPKNLKACRRYHMALPIIYQSWDDLQFWRFRFEKGLDEFCNSITLDTLADRINAMESLACGTNFYLTYQGLNNIKPQRLYGQLINKVMSRIYPDWSKSISMPIYSVSDNSNSQLRIGYLSAHFFNHSVALMAIGYLEYCNREHFEIYTYHIGTANDAMTQKIGELSDHFYQIPHLELACEQIRNDNLHILVFLDIGMDTMTNLIAGLRLAPIQCVWAGHPDTTGLKTIDYYLSSEAHESENAENYYSEKLIRLPGLSHVYHKPPTPTLNKNRRDFGLPTNIPLYLSCQTPFKYLPQYDYLFPKILKNVPTAKFIFCLGGKEDLLEGILQNRIKQSFQKFDLDPEEFCIFLGRLNGDDYLNLLSLCDVSLDTIGFTGSNTTLQAIASGLPVVTMPTELMRGRQSYGIFKTLGVMDTVAYSEQEYVEIATRLVYNQDWRTAIIQRIAENHKRLYDDPTCVKALEQFFREAVMTTKTSSNT